MLSNQKVGKEYQRKIKNKWVTIEKSIWEGEDWQAHDIYKDIATAMINKKICKCTYIRRIERIQLYNGFQKIIITYDNNFRAIYIIESR